MRLSLFTNTKVKKVRAIHARRGLSLTRMPTSTTFPPLVAKVKSLPEVPDTGEEQAFEAGIFDRLENFMQENSNLFLPSLSSGEPDNKVNTVLQEYSDNFTERLFRHRYEENSLVTLDRMYVEPKLTFDSGESWSLMELLDRFLWGKDRKEVLFLEGDAALGKTSIVSYLCYHYLKKDDIGKALFLRKKLVCIRLRELDFSDNRKMCSRFCWTTWDFLLQQR